MDSAWSKTEVRLAVTDYFEMLSCELQGIPYVKADHNRRLVEKLQGRSRASVEFKYANISAALLALDVGIPAIDGYKPRWHYQAMLRDIVCEHIEVHRAEMEHLAEAQSPDPPQPKIPLDWQARFVDPPTPMPTSPEAPGKRVARRIDFAAREARNRRLGRLGEEFVLGWSTGGWSKRAKGSGIADRMDRRRG